MPKTKKPFHKIKIHKNRWLIWAIAYSVIVTIALVGYITVTEVNFENEILPPAQTVFEPWHVYSNPVLGFALRYPAEWGVEANSATSVDFLPSDPTQEGVTVAEFPLTSEKSITNTFNITAQSKIMVNGQTGTLITNDQGHRDIETVVLVPFGKELYEISGPANLVHEFLLTFEFLGPQ